MFLEDALILIIWISISHLKEIMLMDVYLKAHKVHL